PRALASASAERSPRLAAKQFADSPHSPSVPSPRDRKITVSNCNPPPAAIYSYPSIPSPHPGFYERTRMLRTHFRRWTGLVVLLAGLDATPAQAVEIKLARHPDYHDGKIVFSYLGDLWTANEDGSGPQRMTVNRARDIHPRFSPDGKWI